MLFRKNHLVDSEPWLLEMPAPGVLRVRGRGPSLAYADIRAMTERLLSESVDRTLSEVVFDFTHIRRIDAPWTPVVAQLLAFSRCSAADCRITSLHGQPAAIIGLLLNDGACRKLLTIEDLPSVRAHPV